MRVGLDPLENTAWNVVSEVDLSTILAKVQRKSMQGTTSPLVAWGQHHIGNQVKPGSHGPGQTLGLGEQYACRDSAPDRDKEEHQYGKHGGY